MKAMILRAWLLFLLTNTLVAASEDRWAFFSTPLVNGKREISLQQFYAAGKGISVEDIDGKFGIVASMTDGAVHEEVFYYEYRREDGRIGSAFCPVYDGVVNFGTRKVSKKLLLETLKKTGLTSVKNW